MGRPIGIDCEEEMAAVWIRWNGQFKAALTPIASLVPRLLLCIPQLWDKANNWYHSIQGYAQGGVVFFADSH